MHSPYRGLEPATFWHLAQCLNHYATAWPIVASVPGHLGVPFYLHAIKWSVSKNLKSNSTVQDPELASLIVLTFKHISGRSSLMLSSNLILHQLKGICRRMSSPECNLYGLRVCPSHTIPLHDTSNIQISKTSLRYTLYYPSGGCNTS
jgi:hypothetical protein